MEEKNITQREAVEILNTYCVRKNEFEYKGITQDKEYTFLHKTIKGYMLIIGKERKAHTGERTGRIVVRHTQGDGHIAFVDIWNRDRQGNLLFLYRNPAKLPVSDIDYIRQLELEIEELKKAGRELQEKIDKAGSSIASERKNPRGAGRKPDPQRKALIVNRIEHLLAEGKKEKDIMREMGISRPTYYRYKRILRNMQEEMVMESTEEKLKEMNEKISKRR